MIEKIVSGGQTGADRAGLEVAVELGIATGGYAPRGYLTEEGSDPSLAEFGLVEAGVGYPHRTHLNVVSSDGTAIFGKSTSRGSKLTARYCREEGRPFILLPGKSLQEESRELASWLKHHNVRVLNVAGNRASKNPEIGLFVRCCILLALQELQRFAPQPDAPYGRQQPSWRD